jgi:transposase-like protein
MTFIVVQCPHCQSEQIIKRGTTRRGTQRSLCQNTACATGSFLLDYRNRGCLPEVKHQIIAIDSQKKIREAEGRVEWTGQ